MAPPACVENDLVDVAGLRGEVADEDVLRPLGLGPAEREVGGRARADRRRHGADGDEADDPGDERPPPVLDAPARHPRDRAESLSWFHDVCRCVPS